MWANIATTYNVELNGFFFEFMKMEKKSKINTLSEINTII